MRSLDEIKPGLTLDRYELLLPIARGGMAAVWAARVQGARGFEKIFAVKTMLPGLSEDPNAERMFLDEARIASRIRHPNVVEIQDLGEQAGVLYLVMEWVDGAPLATVMREAARQNGIPLNIAVKIAMDACAGLHAAHELKDDNGQPLQVVHRDVSPQNILVGESGIVKIVDFGVAKALGRMSAETADGQIRGKLYYLAPEQVLQKPVDRRTDLFAIGTILYQLTTGHHPFRSDNAGATMNNILRRQLPKPSKLVPNGYPRALEDIVVRALDREPEFRFQSGADMFKSLDSVFVGDARATNEDVAAFMRPLIGAAGKEFRAALKQASRELSGTAGEVSSLTASSPDGVALSPDAQVPGAGAVALLQVPPAPPPNEQTISGSETDAPRSRPIGRRTLAGLIALGAVGLIAVGILVMAMRSSKWRNAAVSALPAQETTAAVLPAASQPPEPQVVAALSAEPSPTGSSPDSPAAAASSAAPGESASADVPVVPTVRGPLPSSTKGRSSKDKPPPKKWTPPVDDPGL